MTDPAVTLTISIDRSGMPGSPSPLVFSATLDGTALGIVGYQPPATDWRRDYAPDSADVHGSELIAAAYQQAILGWDWVDDNASTETQVQASRKEVEAALAQFSYPITTQVSGAPAEVWLAEPGTQTPSARTYEDLANRNPVFAVSVPVYPIPSADEES